MLDGPLRHFGGVTPGNHLKPSIEMFSKKRSVNGDVTVGGENGF